MVPFQILNLDLNQFPTIFSAIPQINQLLSVWTSSVFRFDRLLFANPGAARRFISGLPGTVWGDEYRKESLPKCEKNCENNTQSLEIPINEEWIPPRVLCAGPNIFELGPVFKAFGSQQKEIKLELYMMESPQTSTDLELILQDYIPDLHLTNIPRISLIHRDYEVDLSEPKLKRKSQIQRPPISFQQILRHIIPNWYPDIVGSDLYGKNVWLFFVPLILREVPRLTLYFPPSPMRYFDFIETEMVELRFPYYIPADCFFKWIIQLQNAIALQPTDLVMARIKCVHERWHFENQYKSAGKDQFILTWNDLEFAFQQKNHQILEPYSQPIQKNYNRIGAIYFQLTPKIEEPDDRISYLEKIFSAKSQLR